MLKKMVHVVTAVLYRVKWTRDVDVASLNAQLWKYWLNFKQFSA
jgi:hypothetical protein